MKLKIAELLLPCHCPGAVNDPRVEKAARVAAADVSLRAKLEQQGAWDEQISSVIGSIQAPRGIRRRITAAQGSAHPTKRSPLRYLAQPAVLAVVAGVALILGVLVYLEIDRREKFQGREAAARMIELTNAMSGVELEPMQTEVGRLGDWFYMRGFEGFAVPAELAPLPAVGSRVFKVNGASVAQLAVETHHSIIYVFRPGDFGISLEDGADWRIFDHIGWVAALRRQGESCTMIAFRGTKSEMRELLHNLRAPAASK